MIGMIAIGGVQYPLRYGMSITRELAKQNVEGMAPEDWFIFLIYQAHLCYAKSRQEAPSLKYSDVVDFVEGAVCSKNEDEIASIKKVESEYSESSFTKDIIKAAKETNEQKKSLSSATMNDSLTES